MTLVYAVETAALAAMGSDDEILYALTFLMMVASGFIAGVKLHDKKVAK